MKLYDIIKVNNLTYKYPDNTLALNGISFNVEKGSRVCIIGPNGSGKTTLLFAIAGILGEFENITFNFGNPDIDIHHGSKELLMKIGFLFQNPDDQILSMTVKEEISFALENMGYKPQQIEEKLDNIVHKLNIDFSLEKEVIKLSFGQKRKVALASILIYEPEILLLDEPTAGLDPKNIDELVEIIYKINEEGKTILIATNDIDFAKDISSYVILLKKDHTLGYKGKTSEVISNSQLLYENNLIRRSQLR